MMIDLVKYVVLTEKSSGLIELNQYTFDVDVKLTKTHIKALIQETYGVQVLSVNTHRPPRRRRRLGMTRGYKAQWKRAIVTLKRGDRIPIFPSTDL